MTPPLGSIAEEAAACRAAFAGVGPGELAWHLHHDTLVEPLACDPEVRIAHILYCKAYAEQPLRLRLFRPVRNEADAKLREASAPLHTEQCPGCPWDGQTIFTGAKPKC